MTDRQGRIVGRVVSYGVVLALVLAVATDTEHWPFSAMRLFSGERAATKLSWEVDLVDGDGVEHRLDISDLGPGYAQLSYFSRYLPSVSEERLDGICRAWADAALEDGAVRAESVRIYANRITVPDDPDDPSERVDRDLRHSCAGASP